MAKTINKVELLGRVGSDPEMKYTASGSRRHPAAPGHRPGAQGRRERDRLAQRWWCGTSWRTRLPTTSKRASACTSSGRLVQNSWTADDGQRRYRTEIHAQDVVFLDSARNGNGGGNGNNGHHADTGNGNGVNSGAYHQPDDEDSPF